MINVSKAVMNAKILRLIIEIQQQAFKERIPLNKELQKLLHNFKILEEDEGYEVSKFIEPKEGTPEPPRPAILDQFVQYIPPRVTNDAKAPRSPDMTGSVFPPFLSLNISISYLSFRGGRSRMRGQSLCRASTTSRQAAVAASSIPSKLRSPFLLFLDPYLIFSVINEEFLRFSIR